ncbi:MAG: YlxR family protein [Chloroflexi bacterium]|nr:YlxR family protein [Chloroflexota bacterium]
MTNLAKKQPTQVKHVAQRTCVVCRQVKEKRALIRLVRTPESNVEIDIAGKKKGRGAYLCRDWACWESGLKGKQLEHALRKHIATENREQLVTCARNLLKGVSQ